MAVSTATCASRKPSNASEVSPQTEEHILTRRRRGAEEFARGGSSGCRAQAKSACPPVRLSRRLRASASKLCIFVGWAFLPVLAQQPQNPSPMVEHTRAHPRLKEEHPGGRR